MFSCIEFRFGDIGLLDENRKGAKHKLFIFSFMCSSFMTLGYIQ